MISLKCCFNKGSEPELFFREQGDSDLCRLFAINNALGRQALTKKSFLKYCRQFDRQYHCKGSDTYFFVADNNDNILSFALHHLEVETRYIPIGGTLSDDMMKDCNALLCFTSEHVWAFRKHDRHWYCLNSLHCFPIKQRPHIDTTMHGYILLYKT